MSAAEAHTPPEQTAPARRKKRSILRIAAAGFFFFAGVLIISLVGFRLYLSDARVRDITEQFLTEQLGVEADIGAIELRLRSHLELRDVRIGAPEGFVHDILSIKSFKARWALGPLLRVRLLIQEVTLDGLHVTVESTHEGRNMDAIIARIAKQSAPGSSVPEPSTQPQTLQQPSFPLALELRHLLFDNISATIVEPNGKLHMDRVFLAANANAYKDQLAVSLRAGLGSQEGRLRPAQITVSTADPALDVAAPTLLRIVVELNNFDNVRAAVDFKSSVTTAQPIKLGAVETAVTVRAAADLLSQRVSLEEASVRLGERSHVALQGQASQWLEMPDLLLQALEASIDLKELEPILATLEPGMRIAGNVSLDTAAVETSLAAVQAQTPPNAQVKLQVNELDVSARGVHVQAPSMAIAANTEDGVLYVAGTWRIHSLAHPEGKLGNVQLQWHAATPIKPLIQSSEEQESVAAQAEISIDSIRAQDAKLSGLSTLISLEAPINLLLGTTLVDTPLKASVDLSVPTLQISNLRIETTHVQASAFAWDIAASKLDARMQVRLGPIIQAGASPIALDGLHMDANIQRFGDRVDVNTLELAVPKLVALSLTGTIANTTSPSPDFRNFKIRADAADLSRFLAITSTKPAIDLRGGLGVNLELEGRVPYQELQALAQLPHIVPTEDTAWWRDAVRQYIQYIDGFSRRFVQGMPFTLNWKLVLDDLQLTSPNTRMENARLVLTTNIEKHAASLQAQVQLGSLNGDARVENFDGQIAARFGDGIVALSSNGTVGNIAHSSLLEPLVGLRWDYDSDYRLQGDLQLRTFLLHSEQSGIDVEFSGLVGKPDLLVQEQAWLHAGLPGMHTEMRGKIVVARPELAPVYADGPMLRGTLRIHGAFSVTHGTAALRGELASENFSLQSGPLLVEQMSGAFPVDVRLVFGRQPFATPVRRNLGFAGGTVSLQTSAIDIRNRSARSSYYDRLQPYRQQAGFSVRRLHFGPHRLEHLLFDGRIEQGMLLVDELSMGLLGGNLRGSAAFQLGRDGGLRGDLSLNVSNLDASYFEALNLEPGPASQLNADMRLSFLFSPQGRDLAMNMNITKIGSSTFDRFLQLLDPEGTEESIQDIRGNLGILNMKNIAMWIRYENLNMELDYNPEVPLPWGLGIPLKIPFTRIAYRPVTGFRRHGLTNFLDAYLQPSIEHHLAPLLGWERHATQH